MIEETTEKNRVVYTDNQGLLTAHSINFCSSENQQIKPLPQGVVLSAQLTDKI